MIFYFIEKKFVGLLLFSCLYHSAATPSLFFPQSLIADSLYLDQDPIDFFRMLLTEQKTFFQISFSLVYYCTVYSTVYNIFKSVGSEKIMLIGSGNSNFAVAGPCFTLCFFYFLFLLFFCLTLFNWLRAGVWLQASCFTEPSLKPTLHTVQYMHCVCTVEPVQHTPMYVTSSPEHDQRHHALAHPDPASQHHALAR